MPHILPAVLDAVCGQPRHAAHVAAAWHSESRSSPVTTWRMETVEQTHNCYPTKCVQRPELPAKPCCLPCFQPAPNLFPCLFQPGETPNNMLVAAGIEPLRPVRRSLESYGIEPRSPAPSGFGCTAPCAMGGRLYKEVVPPCLQSPLAEPDYHAYGLTCPLSVDG